MCEGARVRFVVLGPGAVGGVVGGRLAQHGHDVVLVGRGPHAAAIASSGLRIDAPDGSTTLRLPVAHSPAEVDLRDGDIVLLAVKSQDTRAALDALRRHAPASTAIACVQNGVANERAALRRFEHVYGVCVMCPAGHLSPGAVQAYSAPVTGILDVGRAPHGTDAGAEAIASAFARSTFSSEARADIMRWKYAKLLTNLGNALEAVCGPAARRGPIGELLVAEGVTCLRAAGIEFAAPHEDAARRGNLLDVQPVAGRPRGGGSTWQSLERSAGSVETDYLNGEVVLLGRLYGVATPANALLQELAHGLAAAGARPGAVAPDEFLARLAARSGGAGPAPNGRR
jgi:2-dehydropantoate 2-reductase